MINKNESFTSSLGKILGNLDRIVFFRKTGILEPITLNISPIDKEGNILSLEKVLQITRYYIDVFGIKSIVLTGESPILWKPLVKFVGYFHGMVKIGLVTDGFNLHRFAPSFLSKFTWIRINVNFIDQNDWIHKFNIPSNVVLSFNYYWNKDSNIETQHKLLNLLEEFPQAKVLKIQQDNMDDELIIPPFNDGKERIEKIFVSVKKKGIPKKCYMGWIKPYLNADGFVYRCINHISEDFKINHKNNVDYETFDTSKCKKCFYVQHNSFISNCIVERDHEEFI